MFVFKPNEVDDIPLKLPELSINSVNIERTNLMKFQGVILDKHLTWKEHLKLIKNKTSKCFGIMHKVKHLLNNKCFKTFYFAFIHSSYLNNCGSTYPFHLRKLFKIKKKKHIEYFNTYVKMLLLAISLIIKIQDRSFIFV